MAENLVSVLTRREGLTREEVLEQLHASWDDWGCSEMDYGMVEEMLHSDFGLEPDYVFDLIHLASQHGW